MWKSATGSWGAKNNRLHSLILWHFGRVGTRQPALGGSGVLRNIMTKHTMGGAALPRIAGDDSSTDKEIELRRGLIRRDGQIQEAAALLLLLGNELVRHNQGEHGDWSDKGFG